MGYMDGRNATLVMDEYELTMANAYRADPAMRNRKAAFSTFFRRVPDGGAYAVLCGIEQALEYLRDMRFEDEDVEYLRAQGKYDEEFLGWLANFRFRGEVAHVPEGEVVYPNTPLLTLVTDLPTAQLAETAILTALNHQSLVATKATRIVRAAHGRDVSDFGARRAHNFDAAVFGARAAYVGGVGATATVLAGQRFDIPVVGTIGHSYPMAYGDEEAAFRTFCHRQPNNATVIIDTYDVVRGCERAIRVFDEMRDELGDDFGPYGVRIDSGDLARESRIVRSMLDSAGHFNARIVLSNSLDERTISSLIAQGAQVDAFGVGERLITASSDPVFGCVYKLVAIEDGGVMAPRIKVSENVEKITNPGVTHLWRSVMGGHVVDVVSDDAPTADADGKVRVIDPRRPWKILHLNEGAEVRLLEETVTFDGENKVSIGDTSEARARCAKAMAMLDEDEARLDNPAEHLVLMTPSYYERKMDLLCEAQGGAR